MAKKKFDLAKLPLKATQDLRKQVLVKDQTYQ